jgi:hypothetical protein
MLDAFDRECNAAALAGELAGPGDVVLVNGFRASGSEEAASADPRGGSEAARG